MSYAIVDTFNSYSFRCDRADGCMVNVTIQARTIDQAHIDLARLGWGSHPAGRLRGDELNLCPAHNQDTPPGTQVPAGNGRVNSG